MVIDEDAQTSHRQEEIDPQFEIDSQEKASANTGDALYKNSNTSSIAHYDLFTHDDIENFMDHSAEGTTHQKVLRFLALIFITLEIEFSSVVARFISCILKIVIIISVVTYLVGTEPSMREIPLNCPYPVCDRDNLLCPNMRLCEPVTIPILILIEDICIYIFIIDYGVRLSTCWTVSARAAGILPQGWNKFLKSTEPQPKYPPYVQIGKYGMRIKNLIDLACILPFCIRIIIQAGDRGTYYSTAYNFFRIVRVARFFSAFSGVRQIALTAELIRETLRQSGAVLIVFLFFAFIMIILFSGIIYHLEKGDFTVTVDYPFGAYLRDSIDGTTREISPFKSVGMSIYWTIVTCTTLGYGDFYPTSLLGRTLSCICALSGIVGIAFPVGVLGSEFKRVFDSHSMEITARLKEKKKHIDIEAEEKRRSISMKLKSGSVSVKRRVPEEHNWRAEASTRETETDSSTIRISDNDSSSQLRKLDAAFKILALHHQEFSKLLEEQLSSINSEISSIGP